VFQLQDLRLPRSTPPFVGVAAKKVSMLILRRSTPVLAIRDFTNFAGTLVLAIVLLTRNQALMEFSDAPDRRFHQE